MENKYIFLSYRSLESKFALKLANDLISKGCSIWLDQLNGIKQGDDWIEALQKGINECSAVIAVLSPGYVKSKYCRRELKRADTLGKPIFPILIDTLPELDWPIEIQEKQYADFRDLKTEKQYLDKVEEVSKIIAGHISITPDTTSTKLSSNGIEAPIRSLEGECEKLKEKVSSYITSSENDDRNKIAQIRITSLQEDVEAATMQLTFTDNEVSRTRLRRQVEHISLELSEVKRKFNS